MPYDGESGRFGLAWLSKNRQISVILTVKSAVLYLLGQISAILQYISVTPRNNLQKCPQRKIIFDTAVCSVGLKHNL